MGWKFSAFFVLLLAGSCLAIEVGRPELVRSMSVAIIEQGTVEAVGGSMSYLELNITIPQNRPYQRFSPAVGTVIDSDGNSLANIRETNPPNPYTYSVVMSGTSGERTTKWLPESYSVPREYFRYLEPSAHVQSNDPEIRRVALEATANATSDWERVARLAAYVHETVKYDISFTGQKKDAKWVLANKRGVCLEYSTLFIALARSIGIPARFAGGYAYSSQYGEWQGHSWAEAYLGEWVPVDATWLEAGHLDGTHIETRVSAEYGGGNNAYAVMTQGARLRFVESGEYDVTAENVQIIGVERNPPMDAVFIAGADTLKFGQETVIIAKIQGTDYRVVDLELVPCSEMAGFGAPILVLSEEKALMILEPGKDAYAFWRVKAGEGLPSGYEYTCPISLGSGYLGDADVEIRTTPTGVPSVSFTASVERQKMALGEEQRVNYAVSAGQSGQSIWIAGEGIMRSAPARTGTGNFTFVPAKLGRNVLYAYSTTGGVRELEFEVMPVGGVTIKEVSAPNKAVSGKEISFGVLVSGGNSPQRIKVSASIGGGAEQVQQVTFTNETLLNFTLTPERAGEAELRVVVEDAEGLVEESFLLNVFDPPSVGIGSSEFAFVGTLTTVVIRLNATGEPSAINVSIGSRKIPAQVGEVGIEAEPGNRLVEIEWLDVAGGYYSSEIPLYVPAKGEITPTPDPRPGTGPDQGPGCLGIILIPSLLFFAYVRVFN